MGIQCLPALYLWHLHSHSRNGGAFSQPYRVMPRAWLAIQGLKMLSRLAVSNWRFERLVTADLDLLLSTTPEVWYSAPQIPATLAALNSDLSFLSSSRPRIPYELWNGPEMPLCNKLGQAFILSLLFGITVSHCLLSAVWKESFYIFQVITVYDRRASPLSVTHQGWKQMFRAGF